jgi:hypothetical protein
MILKSINNKSEKYSERLVILRDRIQTLFPEICWKFDTDAKVIFTDEPKRVVYLNQNFYDHHKCKQFLSMPDVITFSEPDYDALFGFSID